MEVVNLGLNDLEPITLSLNDGDDTSPPNISSSSVNFGGGLELLMNEKKKTSSGPTQMDLADLDNLERELNDLSNETSGIKISSDASADNSNGTSGSKTVGLSGLGGFSGFGNLFGFGGNNAKPESKHENVHVDNTTDSNIGSATAGSMGNTRTWDGFSKLTNEIPGASATKPLNEREKRRKKRLMLKKLDEWYEKGQIKQATTFTMDSAFDEIEDEYETMLEEKRKKDSVKLQQWWFMTFVNSLEYANSAFNPFDINLDGWGEQVNEDIDSYDEIFGELHEKYKGGKLAPEISLLLRLGFSAAMVNFTNKALSSATPAFNDVIRGNPELMRMFTSATAQTMSNNSPGFSMASNMMNSMGLDLGSQSQSNQGQGPARNVGPPPAPVESRGMPNQRRPGQDANVPANRPDISMARGAMFRESALDMKQNYSDVNAPSKPLNVPEKRAEMRGPSTDIDNILSGLKTRTVDMRPQAQAQALGQVPVPAPAPSQSQSSSMSMNISDTISMNGMSDLDDSLISVASLKDMQNMNVPKRAGRRKKNGSDKNTIALDI